MKYGFLVVTISLRRKMKTTAAKIVLVTGGSRGFADQISQVFKRALNRESPSDYRSAEALGGMQIALPKLKFIHRIMKFIRKTGGFFINLLLILYFSGLIDYAADHAPNKRI